LPITGERPEVRQAQQNVAEGMRDSPVLIGPDRVPPFPGRSGISPGIHRTGSTRQENPAGKGSFVRNGELFPLFSKVPPDSCIFIKELQ